jgi:hypothetical protein
MKRRFCEKPDVSTVAFGCVRSFGSIRLGEFVEVGPSEEGQ